MKGVDDALGDLLLRCRPTLPGLPGIPIRVEPRLPQLDEVARDLRVRDERVLQVGLGVGGPRLAQILRHGAQHHDLAPGELRRQHELVEPVGLRASVPDSRDRTLEEVAQLVVRHRVPDGPVAHPEAEVVDVQRQSVGALHLEGLLVDDLDTHVGEDREDVGERERVDAEQLEPAHVVRGAGRAVERDAGAMVLAEPVQVVQVGQALVDRERLFVCRGERPTETVQESVARLLAVSSAQHVTQPVRPGAADLHETLLEGVQLVPVKAGNTMARRHPDDELQPGEGRLAHPGGELHVVAAEGVLEDLCHPQAHRGVVAIAWDEDQARDEAPEVVLADEELGAPAFLQLGHRHRRLEELVQG